MELPFTIFGASIRAGIWNQEFEPNFRVQKMNQIHGTEILEMIDYGAEQDADSIFTKNTGLRLAVKTADCIPIIFAEEDAGIIAAVHAGWRGLTAEIIPKTLNALKKQGASIAKLKVGIGPSLGSACAVFSKPFEEIPEKMHWAIKHSTAQSTVDLNAIAQKQFVEAGVLEKNIERIDLCTHCELAWPSWRRDQSSRRFLTWIERVDF